MVLYKRKQVNLIRPPPLPQDLSTEVYLIQETCEWFYTYEEYLQRLDYYNRRKFVCEITGNSCLTFFEALQSEIKEIRGVERDFPEASREHILRFLQFNRITRLDQLVDKVYLVFKYDYFPGEVIYIKGSLLSTAVGQSKQKGTIREKVQYNNPEDGTSSTKYLVVRQNDMQQAIVTQDKISRDRNHFTKWLIKTFIKLTMTRSHKVGAPWVVKNKYAKKYRIPQVYPEDLKHFELFTPGGEIGWEDSRTTKSKNKKDERERERLLKERERETERERKAFEREKKKFEKVASKGKRGKHLSKKSSAVLAVTFGGDGVAILNGGQSDAESDSQQSSTPADEIPKPKRLTFPTHYVPETIVKKDSTFDSEGSKINQTLVQPTQKSIVEDLELRFDLQRKKPHPSEYAVREKMTFWDIDSQDAEDTPSTRQSSPHSPIEKALECWAFLNIYHKPLKLDTFTFDDFMYAMGWNGEQLEQFGRCELLDEVFCAALGAIVSNEVPKKENKLSHDDDQIPGLLITLPARRVLDGASTDVLANDSNKKMGDADAEDDERGSDTDQEDHHLQSDKQSDSDSESDVSETIKHSKDKFRNRKKSKEQQINDNDGDDEKEENEADENVESDESDKDNHDHTVGNCGNNAYSVMNYRNITWHDRLRKRNFKDGNWECIMLGVFSLVDYVPAFKPIIERVYKTLAPIDEPSTPALVSKQFYNHMSIRLRLECLNILTNLLSGGKIVRNYIEECLDTSTTLRRDRLDNIRDYKSALEATHQLHNSIQHRLKSSRVDAMEVDDAEFKEETPSAQNGILNCDESNAKRVHDKTSSVKIEGGSEVNEVKITKALKDPPSDNRRRMTKAERQTVVMSDEEKLLAASDSEFQQLWEEKRGNLLKMENLRATKLSIECKLSELDCQRVKLLGKDRFGNRYWWFENNGLPTLHGGSHGDDNDNEHDSDKDENTGVESAGDILEETYLMGRLWVQGPSASDSKAILHLTKEDAFNLKEALMSTEGNSPIGQEDANGTEDDPATDEDSEDYYSSVEKNGNFHEMDFHTLPSRFRQTAAKLYGLKFYKKLVLMLNDEQSPHSSTSTHQTLHRHMMIDRFGAVAKNADYTDLTPMQRKLLEESPNPLLESSDWRFYDTRNEVEQLIDWLNPWGNRESRLRKELLAVKEAIGLSIDARRKALCLENRPEDELKMSDQLRMIEERLQGDGVAYNMESSPHEDHSSAEVASDDLDKPVMLPRGRKRAAAVAAVTSMAPRKRRIVTTRTPEEIIASGSLQEVQTLERALREKLAEAQREREVVRVQEWVNSAARDEFDKSLYEGGDRFRAKKKR